VEVRRGSDLLELEVTQVNRLLRSDRVRLVTSSLLTVFPGTGLTKILCLLRYLMDYTVVVERQVNRLRLDLVR
jgi:hypothetical protein